MRPFPRWLLLGVLLFALYGILSGCMYLVNDLGQVSPKPREVTVKKPPEITGADASFEVTYKYDHYEQWCDTCCDWCCDWWGCWWCCWTCCSSYWVYTDVTGDLTLTAHVTDPSLDLVEEESPRLRIFDSEAVGGTPGQKPCKLSIKQQDIPLTRDRILGTGTSKQVKARLKDISMRFTNECMTYAAKLPLQINCTDKGWPVESNRWDGLTITVKKP
jgi:hypothetical protein